MVGRFRGTRPCQPGSRSGVCRARGVGVPGRLGLPLGMPGRWWRPGGGGSGGAGRSPTRARVVGLCRGHAARDGDVSGRLVGTTP